MSEETKEPVEETPETAEAAQQAPETQETEKKAKKKEKKEKGITFTREQVEKMELAAKQLESVKDQFTRLTAEYDNYRKRTTKEKDGIYQDAKGDTIKAFLAVYDNLERAAAAEGGEDSPHKKGLEMIFQQFRELLEKQGVKGENADQIEADLRRNADTTAAAFENLLDALYSAEAMDISTDIEVLDSILKSQNLTK